MSDLIDRQALRAAHGLGTDCATCKQDTRSCQYDRDYSLMDFCEWIDDAPAASPWHRVEEPPKYSGKVFVWMEREGDFFDKEYIADVAYYNNLAGGRIPKGTFFKPIPGKMEYEILDNVTHWMPIEPPKEDA